MSEFFKTAFSRAALKAWAALLIGYFGPMLAPVLDRVVADFTPANLVAALGQVGIDLPYQAAVLIVGIAGYLFVYFTKNRQA
ncbi:MAG: hypothetical protein BroJett011_62620 [Chloroflexota bacterium]|nr:MAG: hypothetical protein BroJett011_62620 [Chloroflexota bacterium]